MARSFPDRESNQDLRRLVSWLDDDGVGGAAPPECMPPMDVLETQATIEVVTDLPGVPVDAVQVVSSSGVLVIAGQKLPRACGDADAAFHLAERSFGRFNRVIRLSGAFDAGRARATLIAGELHVVLPRIEERRGQRIEIRVEAS